MVYGIQYTQANCYVEINEHVLHGNWWPHGGIHRG